MNTCLNGIKIAKLSHPSSSFFMDQNVNENDFTEASLQYFSNGPGDAKATREAYQFMCSSHSNCIGNSGEGVIKNRSIIMTGSSDHENGQMPHPFLSKVTKRFPYF